MVLVFGMSHSDPPMPILNSITSGAPLPLRSFACLDSASTVYGMIRLDLLLLVLNCITLETSPLPQTHL
jgi:hypothetical protein